LNIRFSLFYNASPEVTSGGNALKFYASVRLDTRRKEVLPDNVGIKVKVKVVKNKIAAPFKVVNLDILFGTGIDRLGCTLDAALDLEIVERRGSWYAYKGNQLAQGRQNVLYMMKQDAQLEQQLETDVRIAFEEMNAAAANKAAGGESSSTAASSLVQTELDDEATIEPFGGSEEFELVEQDTLSYE
jgi:recombination protein RecA